MVNLRTRERDRGERGAVLVEFALVAIAVSLLLAVTIDFGRLMFSAQQIQDVARVAARELSVTPLPASITFEDSLTYMDPTTGEHPVRDRVFNPDFLVVDANVHPDIQDFFADKPIVNKALLPLMIHDFVPGVRNLTRYPGALVASATAESGYTVMIPVVELRGGDGMETIRWVSPVEEIRKTADADCPARGVFSLTPYDPAADPCGPGSAPTQRGLVAIRVNYPYQAAAMTGFQTTGGPFDPNVANPIHADDEGVTQLNPDKLPGALAGGADEVGPYAGRFGLGRHFAFAKPTGVRPFRKLIAAQAIYRREVFQ